MVPGRRVGHTVERTVRDPVGAAAPPPGRGPL